jgi:uncharacterized protein
LVIGLLQFELLIHDSGSLKDKRRVVRSVKDRLHREHMVSVAEVGTLDMLNVATMALACVGREGGRIGEVLDAVTNKLRTLHDAELGDVSRQIIHGSQISDETAEDALAREEAETRMKQGLSREMLEYFEAGDPPHDEPENDRS